MKIKIKTTEKTKCDYRWLSRSDTKMFYIREGWPLDE